MPVKTCLIVYNLQYTRYNMEETEKKTGVAIERGSVIQYNKIYIDNIPI